MCLRLQGIVSTDSEKYNEGVLGRSVSDYVTYIQRPEIWGGAFTVFVLVSSNPSICMGIVSCLNSTVSILLRDCVLQEGLLLFD